MEMPLFKLGRFHFVYKNLTWHIAELSLLACVIAMSSLSEMELFDDAADGATAEPHPLSDDDLPSEDDDDDDDDDDDLNDTDMAPVRGVCFALSCNERSSVLFRDRSISRSHWLVCCRTPTTAKQPKSYFLPTNPMP